MRCDSTSRCSTRTSRSSIPRGSSWPPATTIRCSNRTRCSRSRSPKQATTRSGCGRAPTAAPRTPSTSCTSATSPPRTWPGRRAAGPMRRSSSSGWATRPARSVRRSRCPPPPASRGWPTSTPLAMAVRVPCRCRCGCRRCRRRPRRSPTTTRGRRAGPPARRPSTAGSESRKTSIGFASRPPRARSGTSAAGADGSVRRSISWSTSTATTTSVSESRATTMRKVPTAPCN